MAEEEARKIATREGTDNKAATAAVASEDTDNAAVDTGRHAEATESVPETPKAEHGVAAHDNGTKPPESPTEARNGNAGCGCGNDACECGNTAAEPTAAPQGAAGDGRPPKPGTDCDCGCGHATHDGSTKIRKPHRTNKGHDTLLLALGIVGAVFGASGLAVACNASNEVAALKSNVSNIQDNIDGNASVMPPFGFLDDEDAYGDWLDRHGLSDDGDTQVGFIGVRVQDSTTGTSGAEVVGVSIGEPADKAGIKKGDVIVSFAGENVVSAEDLVALVRDAEIGGTQSVIVVRDGSRKTLNVTVGSTLGGSNGKRNGTHNNENDNGMLEGGGELKSDY